VPQLDRRQQQEEEKKQKKEEEKLTCGWILPLLGSAPVRASAWGPDPAKAPDGLPPRALH
jgi:hypothetical protein